MYIEGRRYIVQYVSGLHLLHFEFIVSSEVNDYANYCESISGFRLYALVCSQLCVYLIGVISFRQSYH